MRKTVIIHFTDGTVETYPNQDADFAVAFLGGEYKHLMLSSGVENDDAVIIPATVIKKLVINND